MWNIYSAMMQNLGVSDDCVGQMTYNEREAEIHFCRPRKTGVQLFHLAKAAGKRVVLTSDMYLDADTIRRMLEKCGIRGWDGFFLSNEQNALKWNGALYRKMTAQLGVKPDHVLHIGDNAKIDVEAAKKAGLHALLLPRPVDVFMDADCTQMANLDTGVWRASRRRTRCSRWRSGAHKGWRRQTASLTTAMPPRRRIPRLRRSVPAGVSTPSAHTCWRWRSGCCAAVGRMA